ncbi:MAG: hypothetical protein OCC49_18355 [Fibrobacterales bacterium]
MKHTLKYLYPLLLSLFFTYCSMGESNLTGNSTQTGNPELAMILYNTDGTVADSATVEVYEIESTTIAFKTVTDSNGQYSLSGLNGTYNIWASKDSLAAFQDSVYIFSDTNYVRRDTLKSTIHARGKVALQPGDDFQTVTVNVLGSYKFANVDSLGFFTLSNMPKGEYNLRFETTLPNYTTTYSPVTIVSDTSFTYVDPFELIYTGIPLVTGLIAQYDTTSGVMTVSWDSISYPGIQEYLVYRQEDSAKTIATIPVGKTTSNIFSDSLYSGDFPYINDQLSHNLQYRVKIRNTFDEEGGVNGYAQATAVPSQPLRAFAGNDILVLTNSVVNLQGYATGLRDIVKYEWAFGSMDNFVQTSTGDTNVVAPSTEIDNYPCFFRVTNSDGIIVTDSLILDVEGIIVSSHSSNEIVTEVFTLQGMASSNVTEIRVEFMGVTVSAVNNSNSWRVDVDSRIVYPSFETEIIIIGLNESEVISSKSMIVSVKNQDPIIGKWSCSKKYDHSTTANAPVIDEFLSNGSLGQINIFNGDPKSWMLNGKDYYLYGAYNGLITISPTFHNYNLMSYTLNKDNANYATSNSTITCSRM